MNQIIDFLKIQINRKGTISLMVLGILLIIIAFIIGISGNPPGVGLALIGLALIAFSLVHHWTSPGDYGIMLAIAVISFPVLVLLHNIFDTLNQQISMIPVISQLLGGLAVICFVAGVLFAPAAAMVGLFAGLYHLIKSKL